MLERLCEVLRCEMGVEGLNGSRKDCLKQVQNQGSPFVDMLPAYRRVEDASYFFICEYPT